MHLDLDAFFASVEQLDHPEWRGRPVIVGSPEARGVVSTASYEARAYGVHSAMPSAEARRLCPDGIWAAPRFDRYRELSGEVMDILADESPLLERMSIDEACLDISPGRYVGENPVRIAQRVQSRVADLGITCSIGLAAGKSTAKIASDLDKPRGLVVVRPGSESAFLAPMPVGRLSGIGRRSTERLEQLGIRTLGQLAAAPLDALEPIFGVNAPVMRERAAGIDDREIECNREVKSVSHERTFSSDLKTRELVEAAIDYTASLVGRRLRREGLAGHTVTLKLRYADLTRRTAQRTLDDQVDDEADFIPVLRELLAEVWRPGDAVRLVGVAVSGFEPRPTQMSLFDGEGAQMALFAGDGAADDDDYYFSGAPSGTAHGTASHRAVVDTTDRVRDRFGEDAVSFGRQLKLKLPPRRS